MYVYGGTTIEFSSVGLSDVWRYCFDDNRWYLEARYSPASGRFFCSATELPDGKVALIALGIEALENGHGRRDIWAVSREDMFHADESPEEHGYRYTASTEVHSDADKETDGGRLVWLQLAVEGEEEVDLYAHAAGFRDYLYIFSGHAGQNQPLADQDVAGTRVHRFRPGCNVGSFSPDLRAEPCRYCPPG